METDVRDLEARVLTVEYTSQNLSYPAQECYKECYTTSVNCCLYSVSYSLKTWGQESAVIYIHAWEVILSACPWMHQIIIFFLSGKCQNLTSHGHLPNSKAQKCVTLIFLFKSRMALREAPWTDKLLAWEDQCESRLLYLGFNPICWSLGTLLLVGRRVCWSSSPAGKLLCVMAFKWQL